jgi:hypothetical protein
MVYDIVASGNKYTVALPPLHWSESDYVFFTGSYKDCIERVKSWKCLKETFSKEKRC